MKFYHYAPSPFHLRRPLPFPFSASFSTELNLPSPSSASPSLSHQFTYLQSVFEQIKVLSRNPKNYSSLTTLDSLLAKTHLLDSAASLVLVDCLSRIKKIGRSKIIISHLKSRGRVSDSFLYSLVFHFLAEDRTVDDVENAWADIHGPGKRFNFSNYVIIVCKFGGVDEIKDVYGRILMGVSSVLDRQSYVALSSALCKANEGFLAKNIVNKMYDKGMTVDNWTYFLMFQCFCRTGNIKEADLVLRKLVKTGFVIDICIYGSFLHGLCESGKLREANKLFRKLIKQGPVSVSKHTGVVLKEGRRAIFQLNCEGVVPEIMAYESYFRALCNAGKLDLAEILLKKMMRGRTLPEICVYGSFIKALFHAGRDDDALKFFNVQRKKGFVCVDEIGRFVIMGLCEKGKTDDALSIFEEIVMVNGFVNGSIVCNSILDSYWSAGMVEKAELFFERWRLCEGKYGRRNAATYTIMLNGYCSHSDVSKAIVVFEEMLKKNMVVDVALYERLVRGLCDRGRVNEAFGYLNDMIENGHFVFCKRWRALFPQSFFNMDELHLLIRS